MSTVDRHFLKKKILLLKLHESPRNWIKKIRAVQPQKSTSWSSWWGFEVDTVDFKVDGFLRGKVDDFLKSRPPRLRLPVDPVKWKALPATTTTAAQCIGLIQKYFPAKIYAVNFTKKVGICRTPYFVSTMLWVHNCMVQRSRLLTFTEWSYLIKWPSHGSPPNSNLCIVRMLQTLDDKAALAFYIKS